MMWAIIPAAGTGKRFGLNMPKQYTLLNNKPVLWHTLFHLVDSRQFSKILVVVAQEDIYWPKIQAEFKDHVISVVGGSERSHSVFNALLALKSLAEPQDWVLVHDAVRPYLKEKDLMRFIHIIREDAVGGLLGVKARDTLKTVDAHGRVVNTLDRSAIWQAQTPQMFRYQLLYTALENAIQQNSMPTDESSAVEKMGLSPLMVEGSAFNLKITYPGDLS